jgi:hypothetical protein
MEMEKSTAYKNWIRRRPAVLIQQSLKQLTLDGNKVRISTGSGRFYVEAIGKFTIHDSFKTREKAEKFCKDMGWEIINDFQ